MSEGPLRILLLEDDRDHVEIFRFNLKETIFRHARVSVTERFAQGISWAQAGDYDIAFLDLALADSTISETIEQLGLLTKHLPVVIMTSLDHGPTMLEFIALGAQDCVPKVEMQPTLLERVIRFALDRFEQRALTEATLRAVPQAMVHVDCDGRVLRCNPAFEVLAGRPFEEMAKRPIWDAWPGRLAELLRESVGSAQPTHQTIESELQLQTADGQNCEGILYQQVVSGPGESVAGTVATFVDLSEARRLARDVLDQERRRSETVTALAGGVAHDFNNRLMVILGHAAFIKEVAPVNSTLGDSLSEIEAAAQGAADFVRQLLAFSGNGAQVPEPFDLLGLVQVALSQVAPRIAPAIEVKVESRRPSTVIGDGGQLALLLKGVVLNAVEALAESDGLVHITVGVQTIPRHEGRMHEESYQLAPGDYARLDVADSGPGMPPEVLQRAFEPFFSTKMVGGRGLGLSAAQGAARASGGDVILQSEAGVGTVCSILLPRVPDVAPSR